MVMYIDFESVFSILTFSNSVSFKCVIVMYIDLIFFATT